MGFLDKLKEKIKDHAEASNHNKTVIVKLDGSTKKEPSKYDLLTPEDRKLYNEFYDKHYDAAYRWYDKYSDTISDIEWGFYQIFDYKKRISAIEKVIKAYNKFFDNFSKYGKGGEIFFELEFPDVCSEYTPTEFCNEYPLDMENINCCKWLLQYYTEHKEEVCKFIQYEYIESEYGTYEAYEESMKYEQHIEEVSEKVISLIKKNDGMLQKDIYKEFDPDGVNFVKSYLKELADASKIIRIKSGNTYALHYVKPSKKEIIE